MSISPAPPPPDDPSTETPSTPPPMSRRSFPPAPSPGDRESAAQALFIAVREEGENELSRPLGSLWWSGIAAGIAMATSIIGRGVLELYLPDEPWEPLVASFGYSFGFIVVVMGHMQLFTENTITTVLPTLERRDLDCLQRTARLWTIVFLANVIGAIGVSGLSVAGIVDGDLLQAMISVAHHGTHPRGLSAFLFAIPAGFLVAAVVWLTRLAGGQQLPIIVALTWLIAVGGFVHVVAGAVELFLLVWAEGAHHLGLLWSFLVPAFLGNVVGGTLLFALLAYAQVKAEIEENGDEAPAAPLH